ncbi:hypothetical protein ACGFZJ_11715 [Streptomyces sp. NPDC048253]|uniref:hypothetical protein n=1 Tax=Streptomyces sp. NPDC048253 TaxID=3365524 RepID=UPI00372491CD
MPHTTDKRLSKRGGLYLVAQTDGGTPGLRVSEVPEGVLLRWAASDEFTVLAASQPGHASNDGKRAVVQASGAPAVACGGSSSAGGCNGDEPKKASKIRLNSRVAVSLKTGKPGMSCPRPAGSGPGGPTAGRP